MNMGTKLTKSGALAHVRTLKDAVEAYWDLFEKSKQGEAHDDPCLEWTIKAPTFSDAVKRAVEGRREDGKMFQKGSCVRTSSKQEMRRLLTSAVYHFDNAETFEQIYDLVDRCSPWGIGRMTKYAVTERLAAYKGLKPEAYLYLHAGPLEGWKRLTGRSENRFRVPVSEVPQDLRELPTYHIENFLCEFRELVHPGMVS